MTFLAIDPGSAESAYALIDRECRPVDAGKVPNADMFPAIFNAVGSGARVAIEWVASYGMAVGAEVFDTCLWVGRFYEHIERLQGEGPQLVYRRDVKLHICGQTKAKDANIIQALIDRFTPNTPNRGKGSKAEPGWFYGFKADVWQAYALAVYVADLDNGRPGVAA